MAFTSTSFVLLTILITAYCRCLAEIIRRQEFDSVFSRWWKVVSCDAKCLRLEELRLRRKFARPLKQHVLHAMFGQLVSTSLPRWQQTHGCLAVELAKRCRSLSANRPNYRHSVCTVSEPYSLLAGGMPQNVVHPGYPSAAYGFSVTCSLAANHSRQHRRTAQTGRGLLPPLLATTDGDEDSVNETETQASLVTTESPVRSERRLLGRDYGAGNRGSRGGLVSASVSEPQLTRIDSLARVPSGRLTGHRRPHQMHLLTRRVHRPVSTGLRVSSGEAVPAPAVATFTSSGAATCASAATAKRKHPMLLLHSSPDRCVTRSPFEADEEGDEDKEAGDEAEDDDEGEEDGDEDEEDEEEEEEEEEEEYLSRDVDITGYCEDLFAESGSASSLKASSSAKRRDGALSTESVQKVRLRPPANRLRSPPSTGAASLLSQPATAVGSSELAPPSKIGQVLISQLPPQKRQSPTAIAATCVGTEAVSGGSILSSSSTGRGATAGARAGDLEAWRSGARTNDFFISEDTEETTARSHGLMGSSQLPSISREDLRQLASRLPEHLASILRSELQLAPDEADFTQPSDGVAPSYPFSLLGPVASRIFSRYIAASNRCQPVVPDIQTTVSTSIGAKRALCEASTSADSSFLLSIPITTNSVATNTFTDYSDEQAESACQTTALSAYEKEATTKNVPDICLQPTEEVVGEEKQVNPDLTKASPDARYPIEASSQTSETVSRTQLSFVNLPSILISPG
ncbi:unnamed protein product [Protopolystoma xenopodis]|uniref:Uncharacterized protein n=1 Tax=Protopolystoma xenopodis TaxID=117903 RepID=A0A3S5FBJ6_9PLAT|nr:unnamed protein product [Protopolystoma xenopodis]